MIWSPQTRRKPAEPPPLPRKSIYYTIHGPPNRNFCTHNSRKQYPNQPQSYQFLQQKSNENLSSSSSSSIGQYTDNRKCGGGQQHQQIMKSMSVTMIMRALAMQKGERGNERVGADDEDFSNKILSRRQCVIQDATHFQQIINERKGK